jgi:hypothetical protein
MEVYLKSSSLNLDLVQHPNLPNGPSSHLLRINFRAHIKSGQDIAQVQIQDVNHSYTLICSPQLFLHRETEEKNTVAA